MTLLRTKIFSSGLLKITLFLIFNYLCIKKIISLRNNFYAVSVFNRTVQYILWNGQKTYFKILFPSHDSIVLALGLIQDKPHPFSHSKGSISQVCNGAQHILSSQLNSGSYLKRHPEIQKMKFQKYI